MATVADIAKRSLQKILVLESEAPFEASEFADFIDELNDYMTELDARGISLGYTLVDTVQDTVTVPNGAISGIVANMAIRVAPEYGGEISDGLVIAAKNGLNAMRLLGQRMGSTKLPSTLPIGTGNGERWRDTQYYPDVEEDILAETTGAIGVESGT